MKVVIEALQDSQYVTGTDRVAYNVLRELQTLDTKNEYIVICRRGYDYIPSAVSAANFRVVRRGLYRKRYWKPIMGPWSVIQALYYKWVVRPDVYYSVVNLSSPRLKIAPLVTNVLDLIPLVYTKQYHGSEADYLRYLATAQTTVRMADRFIAISDYTKADMEKYLQVKPELAEVVYLATEAKFHPITDEAELARVCEKYGLPERFVLTIGSNEPRKNVRTAMKAYQKLPVKVRGEAALVALGGAWKGGGVGEDMEMFKDVKFTGFVDDDDLPALYSAAAVFIFLSTYEGFGLPPLEAMACGAPVVSSNATSLPEVTGQAAVLVAPDDAAGAAKALEAILTDPAEARRRREASLARAAEFTWAKTARQVLDVLEQVGGRG